MHWFNISYSDITDKSYSGLWLSLVGKKVMQKHIVKNYKSL